MPESPDFENIYRDVERRGSVSESERNTLFGICLADWKSLSATWHALGFININLWNDRFSSLRLHIWPGDLRHSLEQRWKIHDHVYDFSSHVIWGAVADSMVSVVACEHGPYTMYEVEYLSDGSLLRRMDSTFEVRRPATKVYSCGETYAMRAGDFHFSDNAQNGASVSLMLTKNMSLRRLPRVLVEDDRRQEIFRPKVASTQGSERALGDVLEPIAELFRD